MENIDTGAIVMSDKSPMTREDIMQVRREAASAAVSLMSSIGAPAPSVSRNYMADAAQQQSAATITEALPSLCAAANAVVAKLGALTSAVDRVANELEKRPGAALTNTGEVLSIHRKGGMFAGVGMFGCCLGSIVVVTTAVVAVTIPMLWMSFYSTDYPQ